MASTWRCVVVALQVVAVSSSLDFLECTGDTFHPAWRRFKENLPSEVTPSTELSDLSEAKALLESMEAEEDFDWAQAVSDFKDRLRGDITTEDLGGFCLFGVVTAYAVLAYQLVREAEKIPSDAKNLLVRALISLAKKQVNDFLESSTWPVRSMDMVALLEKEDPMKVRGFRMEMPCWLRLGCPRPKIQVQALIPPLPPLEASWPSKVVAVGLHTTSTLEVVSALRDALAESWGRGGAAGAPFEVQYAGHPCPSHSGSQHHCAMRCDLLGLCSAEEDAADPLAEWVAGAVDVAEFKERESYTLSEARNALRWAPRRLEPLRQAQLILCTFPTVLCVLLHELFPETPQLFVAIANPLFAAPGCTQQEDTTVRDCETPEAQEFLLAFRSMLAKDKPVRGISAYTVTTALVAYQAGIVLPLAGKAGRYLPAQAFWRGPLREDVLVARSRFLETAFGAAFRNLLVEFKESMEYIISFTFQQEAGSYLSYEALSEFRSVLIFAQDLGLHKFTEHYAMAMPVWVPAREMAYRLQMMVPWGMVSYSGSWRHDGPNKEQDPISWKGEAPSEVGDNTEPPRLAFRPFFAAQSFPYPLAETAYWYEFGEFVAYPGVQEFDSIPQLLETLHSADLWQISSVMRQFRAWLWHNTRDVYAAAASELAGLTAAT